MLARLYRIFCAGDPVLLGLAILLFIYYCATPGIFQGKASGDGLQGFLYLPGLLFYQTFDLGIPGPEWTPVYGRERTGQVANPCPIGPIFLWWPTYLIGLGLKKISLLILASSHKDLLPQRVLAALSSAFPQRSLRATTAFDYWMTGLSPFLLGIWGNAILLQLLRRYLSLFAARFAVVAVVLCTPLAWYIVTQPLYQHATAYFVVTLFVERWDHYRRGPLTLKGALVLGGLAGFSMLVRLQESIWLLLPGLDVLSQIVAELRSQGPFAQRLRRALQPALLGLLLLVVALLVFVPQVLVWRSYYGELRAAQAPGHMRWASPAIVETLFSTRAGLIPWIPLLYFVFPGLLWGAVRKKMDGLAWRLGLVFLIEFYVNASAWDYHGSWAFGPRRFTDATVVFALGFGLFYSLWDQKIFHRVLVTLTVLLILWNGLLMELMRQRKTKSSCAGAYPASTWVRWAKGPEWLARAFERVGYPFVQPAAWIYGLVYRMPSTAFEGIVGNYMLERDWRLRGYILTPGFGFADGHSYAVEGLAPPPYVKGQAVPVMGTLRMILPLSAREPLRFHLVGEFLGKEAKVVLFWNGVQLKSTHHQGTITALVPEELTRTRGRLNELRVGGFAPGSKVMRLDFQSSTEWWKRPLLQQLLGTKKGPGGK